jgi:dTMP kinase
VAPLIAIEGIDGTGKATQSRLLASALRRAGRKVSLFSFPAYDKTLAGALVGKYLNGELGDPRKVDSRLAAVLYAVDRFERKEEILRAQEAGRVVLCDRYVGSNLAHQAARSPVARRPALRRFIEKLEFGVLGLPRADLVLYLDMPDALAQARILEKGARAYTRAALDAHEADRAHLKAALEEYRRQARTRKEWVRVRTVERDGSPRSREQIQGDILTALARRGL